jgi:hypothetical protein
MQQSSLELAGLDFVLLARELVNAIARSPERTSRRVWN